MMTNKLNCNKIPMMYYSERLVMKIAEKRLIHQLQEKMITLMRSDKRDNKDVKNIWKKKIKYKANNINTKNKKMQCIRK